MNFLYHPFISLQVKLGHQETELLNLLKKIPLGPAELSVLRCRAEQLREGTYKSRGDSLLPSTLATFIFESLCLPGMMRKNYMYITDDFLYFTFDKVLKKILFHITSDLIIKNI